MSIYGNNEMIEVRSKVYKRDKGRCYKCGRAGEIIRSGEGFNYIDYITGVSKPYVGAMVTVCKKCNQKMMVNARGAEGIKNTFVPYIAITSEGQIIEYR